MAFILSKSDRMRSCMSMSIRDCSSMTGRSSFPDGQDHPRWAEAQLLSEPAARGRLGAEAIDARMGGRRRLCAARALGLWKDDAAQSYFRIVAADGRANPLQRHGCHASNARTAQYRAGF